ncbi:UNVERIFIED_CONTAM: hypothetical protein GTU68_000073 [Idotea baltica]|nr:hypothetical protein [Idotea baltica]
MYLEMFKWETPRVKQIFGVSDELAPQTKVMAANQGLYNGFLGAGLLYGLLTAQTDVQILFLLFVFIAGIYGGLTAARRILFVQALPAFIVLVLALIS